MPFCFSLQALLHFRQSLEHQQELRLQAANQQVARVRRQVEQIDASIREAHIRQTQQLGTGTTMAELRFLLLCEATLDQRRRELKQELGRQEKVRDDQREIFQQARRQRETLDSLRNQQHHVYQVEAVRREQRELDDLFLLRRVRRPRG